MLKPSCLKTVSNAMERLMIERFIEEEDTNIKMQPEVILNIVITCSCDTLNVSLQDHSMLNTLQKYREFEDKVRKNHLGKTAAFWFSFIEHSYQTKLCVPKVYTNLNKCMIK